MSAVGFDIGNDTSVSAAAVRHRGGIEVLLNAESNRETPSAVSFSDNKRHRLFGSPAISASLMSPKSTIIELKRLLFHPSLESQLRISYIGETHWFSPVHILAMLLSHLKQSAEKSLGDDSAGVVDCVLGVPSYFTAAQRRAYLDAAAIAGLRPLRLLHDMTATALGYGIYKTDLPARPTYVVFVDIGQCDTQVAVVAFETGGMRVLAHAADPDLGGRHFDEVLFEHFAAKFKEEYRMDVKSNLRASIRLRMACEKLKKVLSANPEAPLNIECLMDEKDVRGFIKREEFESLSAGMLERVLVPCKKALEDAGLSVERIHSVELVGSGSRVPVIMKILAGFFRREPSRTLNASECVARGCALQCAMLSPAFRVKEYEVQDSLPFSIGFLSDEGPISRHSNNILFQKGQPIPSVKMLTLHRSITFHLEAFYANESELPSGASQKISSFKVGPFQASQSEMLKVKVRIRLNLHGIVGIDSVSLIEDSNNPASRDTSTSKLDNVEPELASGAQSYRGNVADNGPSGPSDTVPNYSADGGRQGRPLKRLEVPVTEIAYGAMTDAELSEARDQESRLANQDKLMEQTKERKNQLEAYVYEIRNKLFERYRSFATEIEREDISKSLQQTEEWLYDDGDDETVHVYDSKLEELKKLVDPVENRFKDEEARAQAKRELLKCIVDYTMAVKSVATFERDAVIAECNKAEQWLREKAQQQDSLPKNSNPVLWSYDIKMVTESLDIACRNIIRHKVSPSRTDDTRGTDHSTTSDKMQTD